MEGVDDTEERIVLASDKLKLVESAIEEDNFVLDEIEVTIGMMLELEPEAETDIMTAASKILTSGEVPLGNSIPEE